MIRLSLPLFATLAFAWHQLAQKWLACSWSWADAHLDNFLAPILLLQILAIQKHWNWRLFSSSTLSTEEMIAATLGLALVSECVLPFVRPGAFVYDPRDFLAYAAGGLVYVLWSRKSIPIPAEPAI